MSFKSIFSVLSVMLLLTVIGCEKDPPPPAPATGTFTVTIENVFEEKEYLDSGTFIRIDSGEVVSFVVNAGIGQHLSLITSLNDTSDIFIATPSEGIPLYVNGEQIMGDQTSKFDLYDAGSFIHEYITIIDTLFVPIDTMPMVDDTILVRDTTYSVLETINFLPQDSLAAISTAMDISIMPLDNGTGFEVTIENIRDQPGLLKSISEGAWVVHDPGQIPFYELDVFAEPDLVDQAQFNINATFNDYLEDNSGWSSFLAPGAYGFNDSLFYLRAIAGDSLESLAEDGDPSKFSKIFDTPIGASGPGVIGPGEAYSFNISAIAGNYFSMASMLVETNDWFVGTQNIPLFQNNIPLTGDITQNFKVYDAGTETDEFPQLGPNQAPRQGAVNVGPTEGAILEVESDEYFKIPAINKMIKVTLRAN